MMRPLVLVMMKMMMIANVWHQWWIPLVTCILVCFPLQHGLSFHPQDQQPFAAACCNTLQPASVAGVPNWAEKKVGNVPSDPKKIWTWNSICKYVMFSDFTDWKTLKDWQIHRRHLRYIGACCEFRFWTLEWWHVNHSLYTLPVLNKIIWTKAT